VSLPSGQYNVVVKITIFGYPVPLVSFSFTTPPVTTVELTVSAYFIPIQYLPLLIYILTAILGAAIIYAIARSLTKKKPGPPPPPAKPAGQPTIAPQDQPKPPVGYHPDTEGRKANGFVIAQSDETEGTLLPHYKYLHWDPNHHTWYPAGFKPEPNDPDHMFNEKTGQNASWDEQNHQWIDSKTGQPLR
jgi:hypothetical protein